MMHFCDSFVSRICHHYGVKQCKTVHRCLTPVFSLFACCSSSCSFNSFVTFEVAENVFIFIRFMKNQSIDTLGQRHNNPLHEYLYGRSVCDIVLKKSRRPIFQLLASDKWQSRVVQDEQVSSLLHNAAARQIPIEYKPNSYLFDLSNGRPHQGVCIKVGRFVPLKANVNSMLSEPSLNRLPVWVMLDSILDPMNVGAILRTCHFLGVDKIILSSKCAPINATVSKASSGAAEILPIYTAEEPCQFIEGLIASGWDIVGTEGVRDTKLEVNDSEIDNQCTTEDSTRHEELRVTKLSKASLLIFGSEGFGIDSDIKRLCSKLISIPPTNREGTELVSCLNVSASAAIILYKLFESR